MKHTKLNKIARKIKKKSRKKKETKITVMRICYPWLKYPYSRKAKAYMAFLIDTSKKAAFMPGTTHKKKTYFRKKIAPIIKKKFPKLYPKVKYYYHERGKSLDKKHFMELLYARLTNMFGKSFAIKSMEHPVNSKNKKLRQDYFKYL